MYIRDYEGNMVYFDSLIFKSEKKMYESLWKIMFNVQIEDEDDNTVDELVSYIKNG